MIRTLAAPLLILGLGLAGFATSGSPLAAAAADAVRFDVAGRYEGDDAFLLLVTETRFGPEGGIAQQSFDCIADVALTVADNAGTTRMGAGVCESGEAKVRFEILGRAHPGGIEAQIILDYAGLETALPLATELLPAGVGADFAGHSDRVGDREVAFNGTFAARRR